jgi:hypothetical protein
MINTQSVNEAFTPVKGRPVSHGAALAVLGSLAFVAHEGIVSLVPGSLASALTVLFLSVAVLQWLALGRFDACLAQKDHDRADAVIAQAWLFGAIETVLYAAGGLSLLAREGVAVYSWVGIGIAAIAAAGCAFINFRVKWVSCDPVTVRRQAPHNGGTALFSTPIEAAPVVHAIDSATTGDNVLHFLRGIERLEAREKAQAEFLATAAPVRPAPVRLRNASKRIRTRAAREKAAATG